MFPSKRVTEACERLQWTQTSWIQSRRGTAGKALCCIWTDGRGAGSTSGSAGSSLYPLRLWGTSCSASPCPACHGFWCLLPGTVLVTESFDAVACPGEVLGWFILVSVELCGMGDKDYKYRYSQLKLTFSEEVYSSVLHDCIGASCCDKAAPGTVPWTKAGEELLGLEWH